MNLYAQLALLTNFIYQPAHFFEAVFNLRSILDILIIALFFYFAIAILQKTKSISVIIGISILAITYGASVFLNLPLTRTIFQYFLNFFLIVVAVVFQNELRRFFSLIGVLGGRYKKIQPLDQMFEAIIYSVKKLASSKIGALIVFPGKENILPFIKGGHLLDGRLSESLLLSIFDPSSPGHDGAVIIENGRVKKFGVYLPLGKDIEAVRNFGTRHLAALGLSDVSDALIIAVSEEKGTISIFRDKLFSVVENEIQLEKILNKFFEDTFPQAKIKDFKKLFKDRLAPFISSLALAFIFWAVFSFGFTASMQKKLAVPLEFKNAPDNFIVESKPEKLTVTFSGKEIDFNNLDAEEIKASINLFEIKPEKQKLSVTENDIKHPLHISVVKIEPESISLNFISQSE